MAEPKINELPQGQTVQIFAKTLHDNRESYEQDMSKARLNVRAPLPETFSIALGNNVDQVFSLYQAANKILQLGAPATHMNINRGFAERQYWKEAENQEITIELTFNAYYSGLIDVIQPVNDLLALSAPAENSADGTVMKEGVSNFFTAYWNAPPRITVYMGEILYFTDAWIKNIQVNFSNKLDANMHPMSATVSLSFITEDPIGYAGIRGYGGDFSGFNPLLKGKIYEGDGVVPDTRSVSQKVADYFSEKS